MFKTKTPNLAQQLDAEIASVLDQLAGLSATDPDYAVVSENLDKLYKTRTYKKDGLVKPDTVLAVAGNLAGILLILNHERVHVIGTKALGFVIKSRV